LEITSRINWITFLPEQEDPGYLVLGPASPPLLAQDQGGRINDAALEPTQEGPFTDGKQARDGRIRQSIPGGGSGNYRHWTG
jgi:hypothetical protein